MSERRFSDLLIAQPESCSGQSSVSSRMHAAAYRHWSSSSSAPASMSGRYLALSNKQSIQQKHGGIFSFSKTDGQIRARLGFSVCYCWIRPKEALRVLCPSGCVYQLTPAELAHGVSRFSQTAEQHLLPVGIRRLGQLVLWQEGREILRRQGKICVQNELHTERSPTRLWKAQPSEQPLKCTFYHTQGPKTHRCRRPPPPCQWRLWSSEGRWRTEPTWKQWHDIGAAISQRARTRVWWNQSPELYTWRCSMTPMAQTTVAEWPGWFKFHTHQLTPDYKMLDYLANLAVARY